MREPKNEYVDYKEWFFFLVKQPQRLTFFFTDVYTDLRIYKAQSVHVSITNTEINFKGISYVQA